MSTPLVFSLPRFSVGLSTKAIGSKAGKFRQASTSSRLMPAPEAPSWLQRTNRPAYLAGSPKMACSGSGLIRFLTSIDQKSIPRLVFLIGSNTRPRLKLFDFSGLRVSAGRPMEAGPA